MRFFFFFFFFFFFVVVAPLHNILIPMMDDFIDDLETPQMQLPAFYVEEVSFDGLPSRRSAVPYPERHKSCRRQPVLTRKRRKWTITTGASSVNKKFGLSYHLRRVGADFFLMRRWAESWTYAISVRACFPHSTNSD
jgi:hypothetical protein